MSDEKDLRWCNPQTGERVSYVESLKAIIKFGTGHISKCKKNILNRLLSTMTEEDAKKELIKIDEDTTADITFWRNCQ